MMMQLKSYYKICKHHGNDEGCDAAMEAMHDLITEILFFQFLEGTLKIMFNLLSSTRRRPTPLVFILRFIFIKAVHDKHRKKAKNLVVAVIMGLHDVK